MTMALKMSLDYIR